MMMTMSIIKWVVIAAAAAVVFTPLCRAGYVLSSSTLETCTSSDGGLSRNFCEQRLAVLYSVTSGQNNTDAINLMIDNVAVADGDDDSSAVRQTISNSELSITIHKTPIYFQYATTYHETYNYQVCHSAGRCDHIATTASATATVAGTVYRLRLCCRYKVQRCLQAVTINAFRVDVRAFAIVDRRRCGTSSTTSAASQKEVRGQVGRKRLSEVTRLVNDSDSDAGSVGENGRGISVCRSR